MQTENLCFYFETGFVEALFKKREGVWLPMPAARISTESRICERRVQHDLWLIPALPEKDPIFFTGEKEI